MLSILLDCYLSEAEDGTPFDTRSKVKETTIKGWDSVLLSSFESEVRKGAEGERSDVGIGIGNVFKKCVDGHSCEVLVGGAVDTEVEIDEFLLYYIFGGWGEYYFWVDSWGVDACGGVADDFFDDFFAVESFIWIWDDGFEIFFEIIELVFFASIEVYFFSCFLLFGVSMLVAESEVVYGEHLLSL